MHIRKNNVVLFLDFSMKYGYLSIHLFAKVISFYVFFTILLNAVGISM